MFALFQLFDLILVEGRKSDEKHLIYFKQKLNKNVKIVFWECELLYNMNSLGHNGIKGVKPSWTEVLKALKRFSFLFSVTDDQTHRH